jgi:hypothetical protein
MLDGFETEVRQQGLVFQRIEACVIEGIASIRAHCLAMTKAGIEHENSGRGCMRGKYAKHGPLILVPKMKEAIPGEYPVKSPTECQGPHIADDPLLMGILVRHSEMSVGELSTPVTRKPCATM